MLLLTLFSWAPVSGGCIRPWCPVQCLFCIWTNKLIDKCSATFLWFTVYFRQFTRCFSHLLQSNHVKDPIYDAPPQCPSRARSVCSTVCALVIMFHRIVLLTLGGRWIRVGHSPPATCISRAYIGCCGDRNTARNVARARRCSSHITMADRAYEFIAFYMWTRRSRCSPWECVCGLRALKSADD